MGNSIFKIVGGTLRNIFLHTKSYIILPPHFSKYFSTHTAGSTCTTLNGKTLYEISLPHKERINKTEIL